MPCYVVIQLRCDIPDLGRSPGGVQGSTGATKHAVCWRECETGATAVGVYRLDEAEEALTSTIGTQSLREEERRTDREMNQKRSKPGVWECCRGGT